MTALCPGLRSYPTLTIIDLLEKNKKAGGSKFKTVGDAVRYITRTTGLELGSNVDIELLSQYIGREGAAWVKGVNFHSTKFPAMIKELEVGSRPSTRAFKSPYGLLVLSTSKSTLPKVEQMPKLAEAGMLALKYLNVDGNRAFLAIHDDTENLHLHIIYCRFDSSGRLTEREANRFRRYLMEDLTASIAFDLDYRLEEGAKTRSNAHRELVDDISGCVVRDATFEPILEGCKARNRQRKLLSTNHKLEALAIAAYCQSKGDLTHFRRLLADDGVGYLNSAGGNRGGGAVFVDADGARHSASDVNRDLARGKIFDGAFKKGLPQEPPAIELQRTRRAAASGSATATKDGGDAPSYANAPSLDQAQQQEADRRLQRGYADVRTGAPRKLSMGEWPAGFPWGGIRAPTAVGATFIELGITPKDRFHHVELWRDNQLIAVQRSDQIVVYTRKLEDMRLLLMAAHKQWGTVELTGNSKFKARMADIAAELDIPISNPELTVRIEKRRNELALARGRKAMAMAQEDGTALPQSARPIDDFDKDQVVVPEASRQSKLDGSETLSVDAKPQRLADPSVLDDHGALLSQSKLDVAGPAPSTNSAQVRARTDLAQVVEPVVAGDAAIAREALERPAVDTPSLKPPPASPPPASQPYEHSSSRAVIEATDVPLSPIAAIAQPISPAMPSTEMFVLSAVVQIDETRAPLLAFIESGHRIVLLEPSQEKHFRLSKDQQRRPDVQHQLQILFDRQEHEQGQILDAISAGDATIVQSKDPYRDIITYKVTTNVVQVTDLWCLHNMGAQFQGKLEDCWKSHKQIEFKPNQVAPVLPERDRLPLDREHEQQLVAVEQSHTSFGKEKHNPSPPTDNGDDRSVAAERDTLTGAQTINIVGGITDNVATSDTPDEPSADDVGRAPAPSVDRSGDAVASQPPHGLPAFPTEEDIREILRPRRVGPDGVFHVVDLPADTPKPYPRSLPARGSSILSP